MSNQVHIDLPNWDVSLFTHEAPTRALGLKDGEGQTWTGYLRLTMAERDEVYAAHLTRALRRELPALCARLAAEAHDVAFPGDSSTEAAR